MSPKDSAHLLEVLQAIYPSLEITPARIEAWAGVLRAYPPRVVSEAAMVFARRRSSFPPTPGELVAIVEEATAGDPEVEASDAWTRVLAQVRSSPADRDSSFDLQNPEVGRAVGGIGGWPAIRQGRSEDVHRNLRPAFVRAYVALLVAERKRRQLDPVRAELEAARRAALGGPST